MVDVAVVVPMFAFGGAGVAMMVASTDYAAMVVECMAGFRVDGVGVHCVKCV